jgi:hypothetical protein
LHWWIFDWDYVQPGGDPLLLCFVDFVSPAHAATAMDALHGNISFSLTLVMTTSPIFFYKAVCSISLFPS